MAKNKPGILGDTPKRWDLERDEGWRDWIEKIPDIPAQPGWKVRPIPPFSGALARFIVHNSRGERRSVYLDAWDRLGFWPYDEPYWEVYPYEGEVGRCGMSDIDKLVQMIEAPEYVPPPEDDAGLAEPPK